MSDPITPRSIHFNFDSPFEKHWYNGCPVRTYHINILALCIPSGERFIIQSIKACQKQVTDPALAQQIRLFLKQESFHSREHFAYFKHVVKPHYPSLSASIKPPALLGVFALLFGERFRIAMTAAGEHVTAVLSEYYLGNLQELEGIPSSIRAMWLWHCVEEIEHKAVAFDLMRYLGVGYGVRIASFLYVVLLMVFVYHKSLWAFLRSDRRLLSLSYYRKAFRYYLLSPGALRRLIRPLFLYLKPGFHPWQNNNYALVKPFLNTQAFLPE